MRKVAIEAYARISTNCKIFLCSMLIRIMRYFCSVYK